MKRSTAAALLLFALWIALCYAARFQLMEHSRWVVLCEGGDNFWCALRAQLGAMIHLRLHVLPALIAAIAGWLLPGRGGRLAAWIGLWLSGAGLVLYAVTPASFAFVLCALRLARTPRHNAAISSSDNSAQPSA